MAKKIVKSNHTPKEMNLNTIPVSVIMSVYNSSDHLKQAIQSILNQTFTDFEFIIINDCSTDNSFEIIKSIKDDRIHIINNVINIGLAASLNKALKIAKGEYVVRMDADDISLRNRIASQVNFMNKNPEYGVAGSYFMYIGRIKWYQKFQIIRGYKNNEDIQSLLLFGTATLHPSVIIRKSVLFQNNIGYNENFSRAQDYELWTKLVFLTKITNIPKVLIKWRISPNQSSIKDRLIQIEYSKKIQSDILKKLIGYEPTQGQLNLHSIIISKNRFTSSEVNEIEKWLISLVIAGDKNDLFDKKSILNQCSRIWLFVCIHNDISFFKKTLLYYNSSLGLTRSITLKSIIQYILSLKKR